MCPFVTPQRLPGEKQAFVYQCEGSTCAALGDLLQGQTLVGFLLPEGHTLQAVWSLTLLFAPDLIVDCSSTSTEAVGWHEVGSLAIRSRALPLASVLTPPDGYRRLVIDTMMVVSTEKLIFENADVVVECGLVLHGTEGREIIIAAGISPGSVSVRGASSGPDRFEPQFLIEACRREAL